MSKLTKLMHKVFGINADFSYQMGKFGSFKNGSPEFAADAEDIQELSNFEVGLFDSLVGNSAPLKEDINAVLHHTSRQVGYLYQAGIPEWDIGTTYYVNSFVSYGGEMFKSVIDDNIGTYPTILNNDKWIRVTNSGVNSYYTRVSGQSITSGNPPEVFNASTLVDDPLNLVEDASTAWNFRAPYAGYYDAIVEIRANDSFAVGDTVTVFLTSDDLGANTYEQKIISVTQVPNFNLIGKFKLDTGNSVKALISYSRAAGNTTFSGRIIVQKVG